MHYAKVHGWLILTNDLDFSAMLVQSGDEQPTVVQVRAEDLRVEVLGEVVLAALDRLSENLGIGALVTIGSERTRFRVLPFLKRE